MSNSSNYTKDVVVFFDGLYKTKGLTGERYDCMIYVKELDRYVNGESNIEIEKIELISGYDPNNYNWVKQGMKDRFLSIKKTADVEWLESEEHIKELRKQKLEKLKKIN